MGNVYKAHHRHLDRIVALKTLRKGAESFERQVERFIREAKAAARLDHPNIVPCHEFGEFAGWHYLTMAYVAGESLDDRLRRGPMEPKEAARLVHDLAGAVTYAHRQGVVHRDIKPGNVILGEDGRPRLTDFGIAKFTDPIISPSAAAQLTQVGQVLGTPGYMAPEQSSGRRWEVGPSADVYGLGAVLSAALTGQHPGSPDSAGRLPQPNIPADLQAICDQCLAYRPQDRYASPDELRLALRDFLDGFGSTVISSPVPSQEVKITLPELTITFHKRNILSIILSLILLLLLAFFVGPKIWDWWNGGP